MLYFFWIIYQIYSLKYSNVANGMLSWHLSLWPQRKKMEKKIVEKWTIMVMLLDGSIFDRTWCCIFLVDEQAKNIRFFSIGKEKKEDGWMEQWIEKKSIEKSRSELWPTGTNGVWKKCFLISKFFIFVLSVWKFESCFFSLDNPYMTLWTSC